MSAATLRPYHVMLIGFGLEMTLGSLDEDYDVRECPDGVLDTVKHKTQHAMHASK